MLELYNWDSVTLKIISVCQNFNRAMYASTVYPLKKKNLAKVLQNVKNWEGKKKAKSFVACESMLNL